MKKLLVGLAILAVASLAQAELLATWTTATAQNISTSATVTAQTGGGSYSFSMVTGSGFKTGGGVSSVGTYAIAPGDAASASAAYTAGQYLYFTWNTDYTLTLESADARFSRSTTGAQSAQWGTIISGSWTSIGTAITGISSSVTPTTSTAPVTTTFTGVEGLTSGQLALAVYGGTGTANNNWLRIDCRPSGTPQVGLSISGTMNPVAVPEPATMSLLGLGALAMVLRRKIRK